MLSALGSIAGQGGLQERFLAGLTNNGTSSSYIKVFKRKTGVITLVNTINLPWTPSIPYISIAPFDLNYPHLLFFTVAYDGVATLYKYDCVSYVKTTLSTFNKNVGMTTTLNTAAVDIVNDAYYVMGIGINAPINKIIMSTGAVTVGAVLGYFPPPQLRFNEAKTHIAYNTASRISDGDGGYIQQPRYGYLSKDSLSSALSVPTFTSQYGRITDTGTLTTPTKMHVVDGNYTIKYSVSTSVIVRDEYSNGLSQNIKLAGYDPYADMDYAIIQAPSGSDGIIQLYSKSHSTKDYNSGLTIATFVGFGGVDLGVGVSGEALGLEFDETHIYGGALMRNRSGGHYHVMFSIRKSDGLYTEHLAESNVGYRFELVS